MLDRVLRTAAASLAFSLVACASSSSEETASLPTVPVAASEPTTSTAETRSTAAPTVSAPALAPAAEAPPPAPAKADPAILQRAYLMSFVHGAVTRNMATSGSADFTSWIYQEAHVTDLPLPTSVALQGCHPATSGIALDIHGGNIDAMESSLRPGDLLYLHAPDSLAIDRVVVWTGTRIGDDTSPFAVVERGADGLGYVAFDGPYRSFLTHVRRIIGASDPALAPSRLTFQAAPGFIGRYVATTSSGATFEATPSTCERRSGNP